jgi:hypothetical protein
MLVALFFLSLIVVTSPIYLSEEKTLPEKDSVSKNQVEDSSGKNDVKVNLDNSVKGASDDPTESNTCQVTRNGVTETVPADQVSINESGSGDISVKVECDNSSSSINGNGPNKTSIKNDIKVRVNSSN